MLTLDQIITLQDKGFTYEQLQTLNEMNVTVETPAPEPEKKPEPRPEKKPEAQPEKKPEPQPEKKPEPQPEQKGDADVIGGLKSEITALTETIKAMQEQNVKAAQQEKKEELTADSIISSFMNAS